MNELPIREYEPLAPFTAWRIGGPARWFLAANSADELRRGLLWARERSIPVFVLGGGSNILISDEGWPGLVIRYRAMVQQVQVQGDHAFLSLGGGAPMAGTARKIAAEGWAGLEWAEGLPGTLGGAIFGNAGCYGSDTATVLHDATMLLPNGDIEQWPAAKFEFGYRTSLLKRLFNAGEPVPFVLSGRLKLTRADPKKLAQRIAEIAAQRKGKTPAGSSCGSVFKNPVNSTKTAGQLLEAAGMKGRSVGAAQVAEKHANYIVNTGGATAADVLQLTTIMHHEVARQFGVDLELEVRVIGPTPILAEAEL